ncbi:MAG: transposase [Lentisphaeria bacterium]|jgi:REP element-mobilizing transposase RayT|nr:transposase [Lentisphaeria bacterium]MDY0175884.1 transposase [Lentisphaeria bacterium]
MSYTQLLYHIVIRTKHSIPAINQFCEKELYKYIWGFVKNKKSVLYRIGGMPDHLHLFVGMHPSLALADFIRDLKVSSNKWLKANRKIFPLFESWGSNYGAFSYSINDKETIITYISNQKEHHKTQSFADEYRSLIEQNRVAINEAYFMKD